MKWSCTCAAVAAIWLLQPQSGTAVHAPSGPADLQPVTVPLFDAEPGIRWGSSREEYDAARADQQYVFEQFTYESDGLKVGAYLYRPRQRSTSPLPVIVYNRGSYTRPTGFAAEMLVMANRYGRAGFIVVAPHYRGSNGWQGRDEMGGADLADLMNIVPQVARIAGADASRVYLSGESRGGMMVYQALRDRFPAKAAAVWGAFTDLGPVIAPGSPQAKFNRLIFPDFDETNREAIDAIIERRSAIRWQIEFTRRCSSCMARPTGTSRSNIHSVWPPS